MDRFEGLGSRVKERRNELGLSMAELAAAAGMTASGICRVEHRGSAYAPTIDVLSRALNCRLHWLATGEGPKENPCCEDAELVILTEKAKRLPDEKRAEIKRVLSAMLSTSALLIAWLTISAKCTAFGRKARLLKKATLRFFLLPLCLLSEVYLHSGQRSRRLQAGQAADEPAERVTGCNTMQAPKRGSRR